MKTSPMNLSSAADHDNSNRFTFFMPTDCPPCRSFEQLEVTTFRATSCNAPDLGNHVLSFLRQEANCTIRKVKSDKFSIKADLSTGNLACSIKVRFYMEGTDMYCIEFQRRSGDSIAFMSVYRRAAQYLRRCSFVLTDAPQGNHNEGSILSQCMLEQLSNSCCDKAHWQTWTYTHHSLPICMR